ncbi:MAG: hypothetical protein HW373_1449 [Deltaproteobacteria bacterium]|nr:hypothetical protein [Deltaproteobacteria bacterium]
MLIIGGTTQETISARTWSQRNPFAAISWEMVTPYSSAVCSAWVRSRQWVTSRRLS